MKEMKVKKETLSAKCQQKKLLVNQAIKVLLNTQPKVLLYDIPNLNCDDKEDRICLITLQENIIPNYSIKFEICGYTYNQLTEMHNISNNEDLYTIQGQLYYTAYIGEGRFGETSELRKYFIEIEENNCSTKSRRLIGAKLIDLILQNYEMFCITEIFHNIEDDLTKDIIDFYEGLGFTRKCENNNTKFVKSFVQEIPKPQFTKILDTPIEWL